MQHVERTHLSRLASVALLLAMSIPLAARTAQIAPMATAASCRTTVGGSLARSTVWTRARSPYCVTSSIYVPTGITLTVQAGADIQFNATLSILVDGTMIARGSTSQPITFTAAISPTPGAWTGIILSTLATPTRYGSSGQYTGGSVFQHVMVEYAGGTTGSLGGALVLQAPVLVDHSTIQNNTTAGIYEAASGAKITNNSISGNTVTDTSCSAAAYNGGGIYTDSNSTISNNTVSGNAITDTSCSSVELNGGGIYAGPNSTISGNTITHNLTVGGCGDVIRGGGIYANSNSTITRNTISSNSAGSSNFGCGGSGGGIYSSGAVTITENIISGNSAGSVGGGGSGGGIYSTGLDTIMSNTIDGNIATNGDGGGIAMDYYPAGPDTIMSNTISGNAAGGFGGGIISKSAMIINDTISGNSAIAAHGGFGGGGGIYSQGSDTIVGVTVTNNTATLEGGGIFVNANSAISQTLIMSNQVAQSNGLGAGLYCACDGTDSLQAVSVISNSAPADNIAAGLDVTGHPLLRSNSLCGNTPYDLGDRNALSTSTTLDATDNWWGTTNSSVIQSHIYDFFKNGSLERVNYTPYLTAPDPAAHPCPH